MKKKLFSIVACLFMSIGLMHSTDTVELSCGMVVTTVSSEYFGDSIDGMTEYMDFLSDLDEYYCKGQ